MKRMNKVIFTGLVFCAILTGCADVTNPMLAVIPDDGKGVVHLSITGTGERTILPGTPAFSKYEFLFEPLDGQEGHDAITVYVGENVSQTVELTAGNWIIIAKGYVRISGVGGINDGDYCAAEGSEQITVNAGQTRTLFIDIKGGVQAGEKGVLSWNIIFPEDAQNVNMAILTFEGTEIHSIDLMDAPQGNLAVDAGYYLLALSLDDQVSRAEVLHVYGGLTSPIIRALAGTFYDIDTLAGYLASLFTNAADDPEEITLSGLNFQTDFEQNGDPLGKLYNALNGRVYINLDLSACTGVIPNTSYDLAYKRSNKDRIVSLTLPASLSSIGDAAFFGCTNLTMTALPSALTSIGKYTFFNCTSLALATLPPGVISIGEFAFYYCTSLALTSLPLGLTSISNYAFYDCTNLSLTALPASVKTIGARAFVGCKKLMLTSLPTGLESIGERAFYECTSLGWTTLPATVTSIGDFAFYGCTDLKLTALPTGVTSIGERVFSGCTNLALASLPAVTYIGKYAFYDCANLELPALPSELKSIDSFAFYGSKIALTELPSGLNYIGFSAFYNCTNLALTTLPAGITSIGNTAFFGCTGITSITIPAGVKTIGLSAFEDCAGLISVTIPAGVTYIGQRAFSGCNNLTSVTFFGSAITAANFASNALPSALRTAYLNEGAGMYERESGGSTWDKMTGVAKITAQKWRDGSTITTLTVPICMPVPGTTITAQGWQISNNGNAGSWTDFTPPATASISLHNGKHLRYFMTSDDGLEYSSNTVIIKVLTATAREVIIDMFDSGYDGWGSGRLRINVNNVDIFAVVTVYYEGADNTPEKQSGRNTYIFDTEPGDYVKFYWVSGSSQYENSFIAYYPETPPSPAFDANSNGSWNGSNALVYKLRNSMNSLSAGDLLGGFTVGIDAIPTAQTWRENNPIPLSAPNVNFSDLPISAQGWQISDDGENGWSNTTLPADADMSFNGKFLRYYVTSGGNTYYSNVVSIRVMSASAREIIIDMFDSADDGWDGNRAMRILVNGVEDATIKVYGDASSNGDSSLNTPTDQESRNTYTFPVNAGDYVQFYWVGSSQNEISFIAHYADVPLVPDFDGDESNNDYYYDWNGQNALFYQLRNNMNLRDGQLIYEFIEGIDIITAQLWNDGDPINLTAPNVTIPGVSVQGWQISANGSTGWTNFTPSTASMSQNGNYLRYYVTTTSSGTVYSNTVRIRVLGANTQEVTLVLWGYYTDSWYADAALRVTVNGNDELTNVRLEDTRGPEYFTFYVDTGDLVKIFWQNGEYYDWQNAFAVYYSNDPPSATLDPNTVTTGGAVLVSKQYYSHNNGAVGDGTLMGTFIVGVGIIDISNITAPLWREGNAASLTAPTITGTTTAQGWETSNDGIVWSNFTSSTASLSDDGKYLRYYATFGGSVTVYSNTVTIKVISAATQLNEVTIDMFDSNGDGWDGNGALRIVINGTQYATGVKVQGTAANNTPSGQRNTNTYTFSVTTGDTVQLYWISGSYQGENSFIVYFTNIPPDPSFTASNNDTWNGANALVYRLRNQMGSASNDDLLGSFTVP